MNLIQIVFNIITGVKERWDPEHDETILYLRDESQQASRRTRRLKQIELTGNILEDSATGAESRYRLQRRKQERR